MLTWALLLLSFTTLLATLGFLLAVVLVTYFPETKAARWVDSSLGRMFGGSASGRREKER